MGKQMGLPIVNKIIGMDEHEANNHLSSNGYTMRIINRDNTPYMVTMDLNDRRVNVFVNNGKISDIDGIG